MFSGLRSADRAAILVGVKPPVFRCALPLVLLASAGGCQWGPSKERYHTVGGHYTDSAARSAFVDQRVEELTAKGLSREAAAARASREWFASAPVATEMPTPYELKRREVQSEFEEALLEQRAAKKP